MNIFSDGQNVFVGTPLHALFDADKNLLPLALKIRQQLGERAFRFDEYLATLLNAASLCSVQQASEEAQEDFTVIRLVCMDIVNGENKLCSHNYYPAMKKIIDEYSPKFQDRYTLISMACAAVAPKFMEGMANKHFEKLTTDFRGVMDIVDIRHLYRELTYAAGEQDVDRLNELLKRRFFISMAGDAYLQALTEQYLLELLHHDKETGRLVIQIMLDENLVHCPEIR